MSCKIIAGRTRYLLPILFRDLSSLNVLRSMKRTNKKIKLLRRPMLIPRRECSSQNRKETDDTLETKQTNIPANSTADENPSTQEIPECDEGYYGSVDRRISELKSTDRLTHEDSSDPCAGLHIEVADYDVPEDPLDILESKDETILDQMNLEDERFPLPSEPLDKGSNKCCRSTATGGMI